MLTSIFLSLGILFFLIGVAQYALAPDDSAERRSTPDAASRSARWPLRDYAPPRPAPAVTTGGDPMKQKLGWIQLGQRITVRHAVKGDLQAHVLGSITYAELWQRSRGPQIPWTPTGNIFLGFWLEGGMFLLNWQNRFYLLDEAVDLSDADIQHDFMPYARRFAQSDQTADVYFAYPPAMWHIDDIGKFRVERVEGEGLRFGPEAIGRFIHASGDSGRALVVEDYEAGSRGQDTAWLGYHLTEEEIKP